MKAIVVGGGILGLAVAAELGRRGHQVTVLEKEHRWAAHQSGHNSNVVHAGLYYQPGSAKARMSVEGNRSMVEFARAHDVPVRVCGKLVVAVRAAELPALDELARRASLNGVPARMITPSEAREYEPNLHCVGALRVESTAIIDYPAVCAALARESGADLRLGAPVRGIRTPDTFAGGMSSGRPSRGVEVALDAEVLRADVLINCAGLQADRVARMAGCATEARIVPFRGEYLQLRPAARELVHGLIYPVPDPSLPFLGVHLTRMLDGCVHAGPNAVLALRREGYRWTDISLADCRELAGFPGLWRLARRYWRTAVDEVLRSLSLRRFADSLSAMVPAITAADLEPCGSGVRAQAMLPDGTLVQDFLITRASAQVHVLNAPSPAATCSLQIAKHIADLL